MKKVDGDEKDEEAVEGEDEPARGDNQTYVYEFTTFISILCW